MSEDRAGHQVHLICGEVRVRLGEVRCCEARAPAGLAWRGRARGRQARRGRKARFGLTVLSTLLSTATFPYLPSCLLVRVFDSCFLPPAHLLVPRAEV